MSVFPSSNMTLFCICGSLGSLYFHGGNRLSFERSATCPRGTTLPAKNVFSCFSKSSRLLQHSGSVAWYIMIFPRARCGVLNQSRHKYAVSFLLNGWTALLFRSSFKAILNEQCFSLAAFWKALLPSWVSYGPAKIYCTHGQLLVPTSSHFSQKLLYYSFF